MDTLWIPDTAVEPLYEWTANDSIVCERHASPSDWAYKRLSASENREWRAFVASEYGSDANPCEDCRYA